MIEFKDELVLGHKIEFCMWIKLYRDLVNFKCPRYFKKLVIFLILENFKFDAKFPKWRDFILQIYCPRKMYAT